MKTPPIPKEMTTVYPKLTLPDNGGEQFFERTTYMVSMMESTVYDKVLQLKPMVGKSGRNICGYELITADAPFAVDENG